MDLTSLHVAILICLHMIPKLFGVEFSYLGKLNS